MLALEATEPRQNKLLFQSSDRLKNVTPTSVTVWVGFLQTNQGPFNLVFVQKMNKNECLYRHIHPTAVTDAAPTTVDRYKRRRVHVVCVSGIFGHKYPSTDPVLMIQNYPLKAYIGATTQQTSFLFSHLLVNNDSVCFLFIKCIITQLIHYNIMTVNHCWTEIN